MKSKIKKSKIKKNKKKYPSSGDFFVQPRGTSRLKNKYIFCYIGLFTTKKYILYDIGK
jgi:hypothetical protein